MIILSFDTALEACSAALFDTEHGNVLAARGETMQRGHAEALMPMIAAVMDEAGLAYDALGRIAVTIGPGSFTGVRVGVSAARGLALAARKPAIGIGTLEAFAAGLDTGAPFLIAHDARRGELYVQAFDSHRAPENAPQVLPPEKAARLWREGLTIHGTGAAMLADAVRAAGGAPYVSDTPLPPGPDPVAIARLAAAQPLPDVPPAPLYLRPPDAKPQPPPAPRASP